VPRSPRSTSTRATPTASQAGLVRDGGEEQLSDTLLGSVCERVRPHRRDGHGAAWAVLAAQHDQLTTWLTEEGLTVVKGLFSAKRGERAATRLSA
jgi:hypothetical protein